MSCSMSKRNVRGMAWPWVVGGLRQAVGDWFLCVFHFEGVWMEMGGRLQAWMRRSV